MTRLLRKIALTVEQTGDKGYGWVLFESAGGRVFVLKKAARPSSSYLAALNAGHEELALLSACGLHEVALPNATRPAQARTERELVEMHDAS